MSDECVRWVCEYGRGSGFRLAGCVWGFFTFPPPLTLSVTVAFGPNYPIRVIILITLSIIINPIQTGVWETLTGPRGRGVNLTIPIKSSVFG